MIMDGVGQAHVAINDIYANTGRHEVRRLANDFDDIASGAV